MRDINSLNKVILIGRLGGNPELRYIAQSERAVANFSLATNERFYNSNTNESEIRAEWHKIVVWGKQAEFCEKYVTQGKQVLIEGKLRTRKWQDKEGNNRYTTEIHAQNIILLGKRDEAGDSATYTDSGDTSDFPPDKEEKTPEIDVDDDVPF